MSRIGKQPVVITQGVEVQLVGDIVEAKSAKGVLKQQIASPNIKINIDGNTITVEALAEDPQTRSFHGLYRALIANMVEGLSNGFQKKLELVGVGYRASVQNNLLDLSIGFSHNVVIQFPTELKITTTQEKGSNPTVLIEGIDKQLVGLVASKIRDLRKPEPYQGKGIRYSGEYVRGKAGKSAAK